MIKRDIIQEIETWLGEEKILILKGPRQVGKTTIMKYLRDKIENDGNQTFYFNIDEEIFNPVFSNPKLFIKYIQDQIVFEEGKKVYIFIDEFQYIKESGLFLKVLFDNFKKNIQFIISGSSSLEITKNSEFLTGRKIEFNIKHLSFFEYISYKSENKYKKYDLKNFGDIKLLDEIYKNDIKLHLLDYINYSGYPEICLKTNINQKIIILKELVNTYIKKDIIHFMKIENINAFNNLIKLLCSQTGSQLNKNELSNTLNLNYETLNRYLDILEGTYIFSFLKPYFTNIRKEISKMPKVYINDIGTLNNILGINYENIDFIPLNIIENFIYNELKDFIFLDDIYYYRTISKSEIDFIVKKENSLIPIEVKYRNKAGNMPVAINNFEINYKNVSKKILITKDDLSIEGNNYKLPFYLLPFISTF
ncbi:MAG: ATP-binding protein [Candidatus Gracilibacteria bacterium]|nr:ATP-binding protein [Candidatus Gracilibacteria bacterium]